MRRFPRDFLFWQSLGAIALLGFVTFYVSWLFILFWIFVPGFVSIAIDCWRSWQRKQLPPCNRPLSKEALEWAEQQAKEIGLDDPEKYAELRKQCRPFAEFRTEVAALASEDEGK